MGSNNAAFDDFYLMRFLKARKFDVKETVLMWKNFINWRTENEIDYIKVYYYSHSYFPNNNLIKRILFLGKLKKLNNFIQVAFLEQIKK